MRRVMSKSQSMTLIRFAVRLTEINNVLPLFPGTETSKKIPPEDLNKILLHTVPNARANQSYLKG